jgi:hypothetical protein
VKIAALNASEIRTQQELVDRPSAVIAMFYTHVLRLG